MLRISILNETPVKMRTFLIEELIYPILSQTIHNFCDTLYIFDKEKYLPVSWFHDHK